MLSKRAAALKEESRHGEEDFPVMAYRLGRKDGFSVLDCHWHDEMEFFRVMDGRVSVLCGAEPMTGEKGDVFFFSSGELHAAVPEDGQDLDFEAVVFGADLLCAPVKDLVGEKYIAPILSGTLSTPRRIPAGTPENRTISEALDDVLPLIFSRPPLYELTVKARMLSAFAAMLAYPGTPRRTARSPSNAAGIKAAIGYIQENFRAPISTESLARLSGMSQGHFCRVFKQYTLRTPVEFINNVRLSHAAALLRDPGVRVLDAALDSGFNSVSYFIEVFRGAFGTTPSRYRRAR